MKFVPRRTQIIGRMVIKKSESKIFRIDESKVTKFIFVDAVGDEAAAAGVKAGDLVMPNALANIVMNGGASFRPILEEKNVMCFVTDVSRDELLVQTETGTGFVSFDSPEAAESLGAQTPRDESRAA